MCFSPAMMNYFLIYGHFLNFNVIALSNVSYPSVCFLESYIINDIVPTLLMSRLLNVKKNQTHRYPSCFFSPPSSKCESLHSN